MAEQQQVNGTEEGAVNVPTLQIGSTAVGFMVPRNLMEALEAAKVIAESDLVPKDYKGKPGNVVIAMQMGAELGIQPMQALQNIAVINGKPAMYGDLLLAVVQASSEYRSHKETFDHTTLTATCQAWRKGREEPFVATFSMEDAKKAKLWGKAGPWTDYPRRMLQLRARGFCLRDAFADVLRGMISREEAEDYETISVGKDGAELQRPKAAAPAQQTEPQAVHDAETTQQTAQGTTESKQNGHKPQNVRLMSAKFGGVCRGCNEGFEAGAEIAYSREEGSWHPTCAGA